MSEVPLYAPTPIAPRRARPRPPSSHVPFLSILHRHAPCASKLAPLGCSMAFE